MAETRSNEAHDPSGTPSGPVPGAGSRNRPAVGAREASSPQSADTGWQPGAGSTDFLGLEPDLRGGAPQAGAGGATESWLFDIEQADGAFAPAGSAATATADAPAAEYAESEDGGDADATSADEEQLADGGSADGETTTDAPARRGGRRALVAIAVLAIAGTGGWYGWQQYGPKPTPAVEVATAPPAPKPKPAPAKPVAAKPAPAQPAPTPDVPATAASANPDDVAPTSAEPVASDTTVAADPVATNEIPPAPPVDAAVASTETAPAPSGDALLERSPTPAKAPELPGGAPGPGGGRHATDRDWAGMWLEPTIPTDAIRGPTRVRTLNVGLCRAELVNGEFIEGSLHAVGESRIWLDVQLGRMSFDASDVRELVQIVGQQGQPVPLGTQALAGLPRVEVLLPGGSLVGRVLGRAGDRVTFVTDEGMRLSVEAIDVRPAPTGRSRLVGPVADRKP